MRAASFADVVCVLVCILISKVLQTQFSSSVPAVLRGADQLQYLQHLLYLLPPCNCDTLLRLLTLLHTVQSFAQDSIGTNDEEVLKCYDDVITVPSGVKFEDSSTNRLWGVKS